MRRVDLVVVGAHPMDAEQLGGGLVPLLTSRGRRAMLVHLTDGSRNYPGLERRRSSALAREESDQAAAVLGAETYWCGHDSRRLTDTDAFAQDLADRFREWRPAAVITHWRGTWHPRHLITHNLVRRALKRAGSAARLFYGENFEDLTGFVPTQYINVTRECERWWQALTSYRLHRISASISPSDVKTFPYDGYYRAIPRIRGLESGLPLAQALATGAHTPRRVLSPAQFIGGV
jgi:LmbE family N-acetylglucosaminyl deacetylase